MAKNITDNHKNKNQTSLHNQCVKDGGTQQGRVATATAEMLREAFAS